MAISGVNARALELARAQLSRFLVVNAHRRRMQGGSTFGPSSEEVAVALRGELATTDAAAVAAEDARVAEATAALRAAIAAEPDAPLSRLARVFWLDALDLTILAVLL